MDTSYEIFKNDPSGVIWVESVGNPGKITERLKYLNAANPGEYFAYDLCQARIIARSSDEEPDMNHAYDLFKEGGHGERIWVETVVGLDHLQKRMLTLSSAAPGTYLIYDPTEAQFVEPFKKSA
jgi:hypothetical protein